MNPFKFLLSALRFAGVFGLHIGDDSPGGASQTQVTDLPDWAKPYAKQLLGKGAALSETPYQTYSGQRQAGFTPLQQQSFETAATMQPSQLGAQAGQLAGAATLNALGTGYDPYQMGQFTSQAAGQYMSPFLEQAMAPQLREAARASEIQRNQAQAQAVGQGAFGGSRQAIVEAERQRNLAQQQGDIRARGYQTAFDQAQQQFAREQQLREQSRQYGAGLGLQGLQTALQGAGQMGQLGGQQFAQAMDINKLQNLYGGQQQAQAQAGLTQQYQDFLNQQRYPYQQLEFMSNLLRGTPMGTVSTLYGAPSNTLGQIAGLGLGAYGMMNRAGGGMVDSYADGGVTSDVNVEDILSKLSDQQLQQAKQLALAQRDIERAQMIDEELAERASLRGGLGGAFNMLPQGQQDAVTEMAGGGIVAFANGGLSEEERARLAAQTQAYVIGAQEAARQREAAELAKATQEDQPVGMGELPNRPSIMGGLQALGRGVSKAFSRPPIPRMQFDEAPAPSPAAPAAPDEETSKLARLAASRTPSVVAKAPAPKGPIKDITTAAKAVGAAAEATTGTSRTSMEDAFKEGLRLVRDEQGEADSKRMVDLINRISKSEAPNKMDMLASFGFKMAAAASKPGATFLGAAAEGAQVIPEMQAQAKKEAKEAQRLGITLEMEKLKLDAANRKGDRTAAMQHAQNIRILEGQEAQLGETKRHNIATERNQAAQIAAAEKRAAAQQGRMGETMARIRAANAQKALADARKGWGDVLERKKLEAEFGTGQAGFAKYYKSLVDALQLQSMPQLELLGAVGSNSTD